MNTPTDDFQLRLNRTLRLISSCYDIVIHAQEELQLLTDICHQMVEQGGYLMAWVGYAEPDEEKSVRPVAHSGHEAGYLSRIRVSWADTELGRGPTGTAIRTGTTQVNQNWLTNPRMKPWRKAALEQGYQASIALPLLEDGQAFGALTLYAREPEAFNPEEVQLLEELAGGLVFALMSLRTAAARSEAVAQLRESESKYRRLVENLPDTVYVFSNRRGGLFYSPQAEMLLGHSLEYLHAHPFIWSESIHPDDRPAVEQALREAGQNRVFSVAYRLRDAHGTWKWVLDRAMEIRTQDGESLIEGIAKDITDLKNSEEQIRRLSQAVEQSPSSITITDLDGNIVYVNQAFLDKTGYALGEVLGRNSRLLQSGKTPRSTYEALWNTLLAGKSWQGEFINRKKNGEEYFVAVLISPIRDAQGHTTGYLSIKNDITEKKRTEEQLSYLAHFDQLTGLPNRVLLQDHFNYALHMAERSTEPMAIMFLDLDHFKDVNDTLGHSVGDRLLVEVSKRILEGMRAVDTVSRLGGDEFIFILPGCDANGAALVADKLLETIAAPCWIGPHELVITPSIGIAMYPEDGTDMETLSQNADAAMYQAKQGGRNGYRFFTQTMQVHSARNLRLSNDLRQALARRQLAVHYQPQISLQDHQVVGVEALLRWQHPELGAISPAEFVPIAEDIGLIIPIGEWVLRTATAQMKNWLERGFPAMKLAVNLSAVQFRHARLLESVSDILAAVGLPPSLLELELTEAVAMGDPATAVAVMEGLNERGIRLSIDDFGTGYSSLSYLKRFRISRLKIDQSFVRDVPEDPEDSVIVSTIINLARSLGMRTIAEGVETERQADFLKAQGCDEVQGYYYSKPLPVAELEAFLRR
ncbi:MAG: EAL domain-containing protein [Betaproteobacteria bacterium]|nr:EAL domain-containing protein [Betaproteobacteria bacterium]